MNALRFAFICVFLGFSVSIFAQNIEKVTNLDGRIKAVTGENVQPLKQPVVFAGSVHINTNGVFKVGKGKERKLENGQAITPDGMLHSPDGSAVPVFDHYVVRAARVYLVKDGEAPAAVTQNIALPDGAVLSTDGTLHMGGRIQRLLDGHTLRLDGNVIPAVDTVTLKNGKVVVQKDGALIPVATSITMNDGTKVLANGTMVSFDGKTTTTLKEGQTVTLPGAVLRR